jgi:hypothetical protein
MAIVAPPHFKGGSTCQACPAVPTVAQEQQADTRDRDQIKCSLEEPDPALDLLSIMRLLDWEFLNSHDPWFLPNDSSRLVEYELLPKTWRLQIHSCSQKKKNPDHNQFSVQHMKSIWLTAFVQVSETAK